MDLVVLFRKFIKRRDEVKPAALVREETEMHISSMRLRWGDLQAKADALAYEPAPHGARAILWIIGLAIDMTAREGKFRVRIGKFIDFERVDAEVVNEVVSVLKRDGYTVIKSGKAGKVSGIVVSWATKVF